MDVRRQVVHSNSLLKCYEDEEDSEVEYVEGYDELEKKDDIEDFGGFAIHESWGDDDDYNENAGSTDDEDELEALDQMRAARKTTLASKGLENDTLESKSKKKARVERDDADES